MNTAKTKRWNGKIETLSAEYLNDVLRQMTAYGDRVQFALTRGGQRPHYQVINAASKKMGFDSNHHLLDPKTDEFVAATTSGICTLDQIKAAMAGSPGKTPSARTSRVGTGSSTGTGRNTAAKKTELIDAEKYAYFKENRQTLPAEIGQHTKEITALMSNGLSAEDAFNEVVKLHF